MSETYDELLQWVRDAAADRKEQLDESKADEARGEENAIRAEEQKLSPTGEEALRRELEAGVTPERLDEIMSIRTLDLAKSNPEILRGIQRRVEANAQRDRMVAVRTQERIDRENRSRALAGIRDLVPGGSFLGNIDNRVIAAVQNDKSRQEELAGIRNELAGQLRKWESSDEFRKLPRDERERFTKWGVSLLQSLYDAEKLRKDRPNDLRLWEESQRAAMRYVAEGWSSIVGFQRMITGDSDMKLPIGLTAKEMQAGFDALMAEPGWAMSARAGQGWREDGFNWNRFTVVGTEGTLSMMECMAGAYVGGAAGASVLSKASAAGKVTRGATLAAKALPMVGWALPMTVKTTGQSFTESMAYWQTRTDVSDEEKFWNSVKQASADGIVEFASEEISYCLELGASKAASRIAKARKPIEQMTIRAARNTLAKRAANGAQEALLSFIEEWGEEMAADFGHEWTKMRWRGKRESELGRALENDAFGDWLAERTFENGVGVISTLATGFASGFRQYKWEGAQDFYTRPWDVLEDYNIRDEAAGNMTVAAVRALLEGDARGQSANLSSLQALGTEEAQTGIEIYNRMKSQARRFGLEGVAEDSRDPSRKAGAVDVVEFKDGQSRQKGYLVMIGQGADVSSVAFADTAEQASFMQQMARSNAIGTLSPYIVEVPNTGLYAVKRAPGGWAVYDAEGQFMFDNTHQAAQGGEVERLLDGRKGMEALPRFMETMPLPAAKANTTQSAQPSGTPAPAAAQATVQQDQVATEPATVQQGDVAAEPATVQQGDVAAEPATVQQSDVAAEPATVQQETEENVQPARPVQKSVEEAKQEHDAATMEPVERDLETAKDAVRKDLEHDIAALEEKQNTKGLTEEEKAELERLKAALEDWNIPKSVDELENELENEDAKQAEETKPSEETKTADEVKPAESSNSQKGPVDFVDLQLEHLKRVSKAPSDVQWTEKKYKSENFWSDVRLGMTENDAYFKMTGKGQKTLFFEIQDFRDHTIQQVEQELLEWTDGSDAYPLGRAFNNALWDLADYGMAVGMAKPVTRSMTEANPAKTNKPAEEKPAEQPKSAEEKPAEQPKSAEEKPEQKKPALDPKQQYSVDFTPGKTTISDSKGEESSVVVVGEKTRRDFADRKSGVNGYWVVTDAERVVVSREVNNVTQNRDMGSKQSREMVANIVESIRENPSQILDDKTIVSGAPTAIVVQGQDGKNHFEVHYGNHRAQGTLDAYNNAEVAQKMKTAVEGYAREKGVDISNIRKPFLLFVESDGQTVEQLQQGTQKGNHTATRVMSPSQNAQSDALLLAQHPEVMRKYIPGGNLATDNFDFLRKFMEITDTQNAGLLDENNRPTMEAENRVSRAMFAYFVRNESPQRQERMLKSVIDNAADNNINSLVKGIMANAITLARIEAENPDYAIGGEMVNALDSYLEYKRAKASGAFRSIEQWFEQDSFDFGDQAEKKLELNDVEKDLARIFDKIKSIVGIRRFFSQYALKARQESNGENLFSDLEQLTKAQIIHDLTNAVLEPEDSVSSLAFVGGEELEHAPRVDGAREANEAEEKKVARQEANKEKEKNISDVVRLAKQLFPKYDFVVYDTMNDMPEEHRSQVPEGGIVECYNDGKGTIHIVVENMPTDQIAIRQKLISHEIIGHDGIKQLMGKRYDNILDMIFNDHHGKEEFQAIAKQYNFNLETETGRRQATEEWLAHVADYENPPSWFNRVVSKIREILRKVFDIKWSDNDIRALIASASQKAMAQSQGIKFSIRNLWTGSAADYEKPSLHYVGTGEGAQVYGWGLYATDNREIAKWYVDEHVKFSLAQQEYDDVVSQYQGTDQWMKAPNGKDTNLDERQWVQVRTPSFKRWFGDWENDPKNASKVVDENGEPLVVYHGTQSDFNTFLHGKPVNGKVWGRGFYFTDSNEDALKWGKRGGYYPEYAKVIQVFLNIRNPLMLNEYGNDGVLSRLPQDFLANIQDDEIVDSFQNDGYVDQIDETDWAANHLRQYIDAQGYDGIIGNYEDNLHTVAFNSRQIKSATDNTGEFSGENPDIRFSLVQDKKIIDEFQDKDKYIETYRAAMLADDGKLYPPMATKGGEGMELGKVYKSEEHPELLDKKGKFPLQSDMRDSGKRGTIAAAYNPYFHSSLSPLNDQFSVAYDKSRMVTVRCRVLKSDISSGYQAEGAKNSVGEWEWKAGPVASQMKGDKARKVIISQYIMPVEIIPDSVVARDIAKLLEGENVTVPWNVVTPSLREALIKAGVKVGTEEEFRNERNQSSLANEAIRQYFNSDNKTKTSNNTQLEFDFNYEQRKEALSEREEKNQEDAKRDAINVLRRCGGTLLGLGITKDFKSTGVATLVGRRITSPTDLADAAQIFRNPHFETFRYVFVKNNEVVYANAVTMRMPGAAMAFAGENVSEFIRELNEQYTKADADGYYLLHNHPSGNVVISGADYNTTKNIRTALKGEFLGHVIINHKKYSLIDKYGNTQDNMSFTPRSETAQYDPKQNPSLVHPLLGTKVTTNKDVAASARAIQQSNSTAKGSAVLFGMSPQLEIKCIATIPLGDVGQLSEKRLYAMARQLGRISASSLFFLGNVDSEYVNYVVPAVRSGLLLDAVMSDGTSIRKKNQLENAPYHNLGLKTKGKTVVTENNAIDAEFSLTPPAIPTPEGPEAENANVYADRSIQASAVTPIEDLRAMRLPLILELARSMKGNVKAVDSIPRIFHGQALGVFRPDTRQMEVLRRLAMPQVLERSIIVPQADVETQRKMWMDYWTDQGIPESEIEIVEMPVGDDVSMKAIRHDRTLSEFRKVAAHEIGHLIDYNSGSTMSHGNVLGVVGGMLKTYLMHVIGETPKDVITKEQLKKERKRLRKEAEDYVNQYFPKPPASDTAARSAWNVDVGVEYTRLFEELCDNNGWFRKAVVREEMIDLTRWWSGDFEEDSNYGMYRMKPTELFAETMSVLINAPDEFMKCSPETWRMIQNYQANKADFHKAWRGLMDLMNDEAAYAQALLEIQRRGFDAGEVAALAALEEKPAFSAAEQWRAVKRMVVNKFADVADASKNLVKSGQVVFSDTPLSAITEAQHASVKDYYMKVATRLVQPLLNMGITEKDIGLYMQNKRIENDPSLNDTDRGILNPNGLTAEDATLALEELHRQLGDEKWNALEAWHKDYWQLRRDTVIQMMEDSGAYSQELIEHSKKNEWYAYRKILSTLYGKNGASTGGSSAQIYGLKGTVTDAANPLAFTFENDLRIMGGILWNTARMRTVDLARQFFPTLIRKPSVRGTLTDGTLVYRDAPEGYIRMLVLRNGRFEQWDVANAFAKGFNNIVDEDLYNTMGAFSRLTNYFRMGWTTYNPKFLAGNILRDYGSTYIKMNWEDGPSMLQNAYYWAKGMKEAFGAEFGGISSVIEEMERLNMFQPAQKGHGRVLQKGTELERLMAKYELSPSEKKGMGKILMNILKNPLKAYMRLMEHLFNATERGVKAGGYLYMKEKNNFTQDEMRYHVVKHIGSPDFATRGTQTFFTNTLFVFSNAAIQGMSASTEQLKTRPGSYAARWMATSGLATVLTWGLESGAMLMLLKALGFDDDDEIVKFAKWQKQMYSKITHYQRYNYMCLPIAETDDGQCIHIRIPYEENSRVPAMILRAMLDEAYSEIPKSYGVGTEAARAIGTMGTNMNPMLAMFGDAAAFAMGYNIYDRHYGRPRVRTRDFNAGGWYRAKGIGSYMWREYSPYSMIKWDPTNENYVYDIISAILGFGALVRVTKSGEKEIEREKKTIKTQENARMKKQQE